jgi:uncharacterized DUF497 family protein
MPSTFDPAKDAANRRKHGISLVEGDGVLNDPLALTIEDVSSQGEQRFISVGMNVFGQLRVVVYALRGDDARIISVRKPEPKEIRAYEKGV